jgi:hypothetical protein
MTALRWVHRLNIFWSLRLVRCMSIDDPWHFISIEAGISSQDKKKSPHNLPVWKMNIKTATINKREWQEIHFTVDNSRQTAILSLIVYANLAAEKWEIKVKKVLFLLCTLRTTCKRHTKKLTTRKFFFSSKAEKNSRQLSVFPSHALYPHIPHTRCPSFRLFALSLACYPNIKRTW